MEPFLGEVRCFAINYAPHGWLPCDGRALSTISFSGLYSLLGTTFGSTTQGSFNLPKIQQVVIVGAGQGPGLAMYAAGATGGEQIVTLGTQHLPAHTHALPTSTLGVAGTGPSASTFLAPAPGVGRHSGPELYADPATQTTTAVTMAAAAAGSRAQDRRTTIWLRTWC